LIEALRDEIGIYLQDLELVLFKELRKAFAQAFRHVLEYLDIVIRDKRDPRYEVKERVGTTLETLLGVQVSFKRRRYKDTVTGDSVYLLDEVLGMVEGTQTSPALVKLMLQLAIMMSYRDAEASLEQFYGYRPVCHETIRQVVLKTGKALEEINEEKLRNPQGKRKADLIFVEADGLHVSLQNEKRRSIEEFSATIHEGWEPRTPGSKDFKLVNPNLYRTQQGADFWEQASRYIYSIYDIDDDTTVVINGDRASWIRQGIDYFPKAIYQVDRYHLKRDIRNIFGKDSKVTVELFQALDSTDVTGSTFLAKLAEAKLRLRDSDKAKDCQRLLNDLADIPEATVDYRRRLKALNRPVESLRGLGAGESQMSRYSQRVKGKRSWKPEGLGAMMEVLAWQYGERMNEFNHRISEVLNHVEFTPLAVKNVVKKAVRKVAGFNRWDAGVPIKNAGRTWSSGISNLMHRLNESGMPI
jgi:hypothetical protein